MKPQYTLEQLDEFWNKADSSRGDQAYLRNDISDVINALKDAYEDIRTVEEMQKTLEQISNTEWHPNADLVNVEIAYEMRALAKEALQSLKEDKPNENRT